VKSKLATMVMTLFIPSSANAEFVVASEIEGWFCSGFIVEKCSLKSIDAFSESKDGQLFEFAKSFKRVDEYNSRLSRCWLNNERAGYHAFASAPNGRWEYLGKPDSVTFKCDKTH